MNEGTPSLLKIYKYRRIPAGTLRTFHGPLCWPQSLEDIRPAASNTISTRSRPRDTLKA